MANVAVIGAQWGDEGKGKIVDWLAERADMVVRFQGGHNAGHTLVVGDKVYKLSLLPSGIVRGTPSVIGNGVVLDPWALKAEIARLGEQGVHATPDTLRIADNCALILPFHRDLDGLREDASGAGKIGTTRRGIGPAYEDKVGRRAIRVCDLAHLDDLGPQLDRLTAHHDALRAGFGEPPIDRERLLAELREIAGFVLPFAKPVWRDLNEARSAGKRILFEGAQGVTATPETLRIADNCALILPFHRDLDGLREDASGAGKIGTTRRGIGPAYEDKVGRRAIRVCDLAHLDDLGPQLDRLTAHHDALRAGFGEPPIDRAALIAELREIAGFVLPFAKPVWRDLNAARAAGKRILFEGAQGVLLDVDHGTYPFVTSSNTIAGAAAGGSGLGPSAVGFVLGIAKAYTTRVGSGPFPTELENETGERLGVRGHEFGTVTGRKRRCGWFDAVLVRQSAAVGGITGIALTKIDVLDGFETVSICTGYRLRGETLDYFPAHAADQALVEPVYETMEGWQETTAGARSWADLPAQAIKYIRRIEELIRCPVALVSTSPERADTILVRDPFSD